MRDDFPGWHGTTILAVRKGGRVVVAGDGQVSLGPTILKGTARKVRRLSVAGAPVVAGFAGSTADAFTLLERLEAKGWLLRVPSPADKRVKLLRLTLDGERLLRRVEPAVRRVQQRLLEPLAPADRASVLRLLGQIAAVHNEVTSVPLRAAERG